jgi:undecaprenyl-diphosphatase
MTLIQAILLGIIQGLSEFLPISSTAHLRIIPALLGWEDPGAAFTAVIQIGTLIAVLIYFYQDLVRIISATLKGITTGKFFETEDARMGWMMVIGTIPIVIAGLFFKDYIESTLRSLYVISASLIGLALVLAVAEFLVKWRASRGEKQKQLNELHWSEAITVGLVQCIALIPGSSRSGVTITAGLFLGMSRDTAARFSFLLSMPSVFAAGIYQLIKARKDLFASGNDVLNLIVATAVSGIVGYLSIAFLLTYLKNNTTFAFVFYRIALGLILLTLLATGKLAAN